MRLELKSSEKVHSPWATHVIRTWSLQGSSKFMGGTCDKNLTHTKCSLFMGDTCHQPFGLTYACANLSLNPHAQLANGARNLKVIWAFIYFNTLCMRVTKALTILCGCTDSPEPSLIAHIIGTKILCAGSIIFHLCLVSLGILFK